MTPSRSPRRDSILRRLVRAARYRLCRLLRLSYRIEMVAERLLCEPIQDGAGTASERFVIRRADESDLAELGRLVNDRKLRLFGTRLAEGKSCYVALDGKRVAYFGWLVFDEHLTPTQIAGAIAILLGIWVARPRQG